MAEDDNQDQAQKTEDPTPKRLMDAKKKGQVVTSREITSFLLLMLLALMVTAFADDIASGVSRVLTPLIEKPDLIPMDIGGVASIFRTTTIGILLVIILPLAASVIVSVVANYAQHGNIWTAEPLKPKLNRISPLAGFKRIFSLRSVVEFLKGIIKIIIVGVGAYYATRSDLATLKSLPSGQFNDILEFIILLISKMMIAVCIAMFFIAVIDYAYQYYEFIKQNKMSRQEIKDEFKQQEGDPQIKQRLRQLRMERAQNRMMQAVPESDVIITNPTHFAVALRYDQNTMQAPMVVAKGADFVAQKIRELAEENDVPLVRNPPLARALFDNTEIEEEVPLDHYKAVAEVISYVYKLKRKVPNKRLGMQPPPPPTLKTNT